MSDYQFLNSSVSLGAAAKAAYKQHFCLSFSIETVSGEYPNGENMFEQNTFTQYYDSQDTAQLAQFFQDYTDTILLAHYQKCFTAQGSYTTFGLNHDKNHNAVGELFFSFTHKIEEQVGRQGLNFLYAHPQTTFINQEGLELLAPIALDPHITQSLWALSQKAKSVRNQWHTPNPQLQKEFVMVYQQIRLGLQLPAQMPLKTKAKMKI